MFHRRLALLMIFFLLGASALLARAGRLTIIDGKALLLQAERRLVSQRMIDTSRGRILDRTGRVLAMDRPAFDIAVDYNVITGEWAIRQAAKQTRRDNRDRWHELSPERRDELIEQALPEFEAQQERFWEEFTRISGLDRETLEERKDRVIAHVRRMAVGVWEKRRLVRQQELNRERETVVEVSLADVARPIREQKRAHVLLTSVDDTVAFAFRRLAETSPGLSVRDGARRAYPYESMDLAVDLSSFPATLREDRSAAVTVTGVATNLLGWMRDKVFEEDITRRQQATQLEPSKDAGRYLPGDSVGTSGLEKTFELVLRGKRGTISRRLDTGTVDRIDPAPGEDLKLTLDIELQAHLQALLDPALGLTSVQDWHGNADLPVGTPLAAGAAVIEIETGDVLALASWPTFSRSQLQDESDRIFGDEIYAPTINRALNRPYPPGSIVKPLVLATAVSKGVHQLGDLIQCDGHLLPGRDDIYRCWIYRAKFGYATHSMQVDGPLDGSEAIARSCNIYFYTLGRALGPTRMADMFRQLGVGSGFRHGLESGAKGFIGRLDGSPLEPSDAIFLGIGQGPVSWTPLHAANAFATLARKGISIEPRLLVDGEPQQREDFHWDAAAVDTALEGMERGVSESFGTGNHYTLPTGRKLIFDAINVRIAGKTGTAQAGPILADADRDGKPDRDSNGDYVPLRTGDHSWTTVLVGPKGGSYQYAISVVVEYGGSGGRVAGPIANQVIHALQQEGYLPGGAP